MSEAIKNATSDSTFIQEIKLEPFYRELPRGEYVFPEEIRRLQVDGTLDVAATLVALREVIDHFLVDKLPRLEFFARLGLDAATWPDFEKRFAATAPDLVGLIVDTACGFASDMIADDTAVLMPSRGESSEAGQRLKAASFLLPLVSVEQDGRLYAVTPGEFFLASRMARCSFSNASGDGKRLLDDLRADLRVAVGLDSNAFFSNGDGYCYDTEPDLYELHASAGSDQVINEPDSRAETPTQGPDAVALDAGASRSSLVGTLRFQWRQLEGGPRVTWLTTLATDRPQFLVPAIFKDETIRFEVTVSDGAATSAKDEVAVRILNANDAPSVFLTVPETVAQGQEFLAIARGEDPNQQDELKFSWTAKTASGVRAGLGKEQNPVPRLSEVRMTAPLVAGAKELLVETVVTDGHPAEKNGAGRAQKKVRLTPPVPIRFAARPDILDKDATDVAKRTGGRVDRVGRERAEQFPVESIIKTLVIEGDKPDDFLPCILIDGSGSMAVVAHKLAARATEVLEKSLSQVTPGGTVQIALFVYGNGETVPLYWTSKPILNGPAGQSALDAAIKDFAKKAEEAAVMIEKEPRNFETLWHSMGWVMAGPEKLPFKSGPNRVQRIIALTDFEIDSPENILVSKSGKTWSKEAAITDATRLGIEFWPVLFGNEPKTLEDYIFDARSAWVPVRQSAVEGLLRYDSDERARAALIELAKDKEAAVRNHFARAMATTATRSDYIPVILDMLAHEKDADAGRFAVHALWRLRAKQGSDVLRKRIANLDPIGQQSDRRDAIQVLAQIGDPNDFEYLVSLKPAPGENLYKYDLAKYYAQIAVYAEASADRRTLPYLKDILTGAHFGPLESADAGFFALMALAKMATPDDQLLLTELHWRAVDYQYKTELRRIRNNLDLPADQRLTYPELKKAILAAYTDNTSKTLHPGIESQIPE